MTTLAFETNPALVDACTALDELRAQRAAVLQKKRERWPGGAGNPVSLSDLDFLQVLKDLKQLDAAIAAAEVQVPVLEAAARQAIIEPRRPGQVAQTRQLMASIERVIAEAEKLEAYDQVTAEAVGFAPRPVGELPGLRAWVERLRAEFKPPKVAPAALAPKVGKTRVHFVESCLVELQFFNADDEADLDTNLTRDLISRGIAKQVGSGGLVKVPGAVSVRTWETVIYQGSEYPARAVVEVDSEAAQYIVSRRLGELVAA